MTEPVPPPDPGRVTLLYHFCRVHLPSVALPRERFDHHLARTFRLYQPKVAEPLTWAAYLDTFYALDWAVCTI